MPISGFHQRCKLACSWLALCLCISTAAPRRVVAADPPVTTPGSAASDSTEPAPSPESVDRGAIGHRIDDPSDLTNSKRHLPV